MDHDLLSALLAPFGFLTHDRGFHVLGQEDTRASGRGFIILASPEFQLRISADRGETFVDIAAAVQAAEWFDLNLVGIMIRGGDLLDQQDARSLAAFLHDDYGIVKQKFSNLTIAETTRQLKDLEKQRVTLMFPQLRDKAE